MGKRLDARIQGARTRWEHELQADRRGAPRRASRMPLMKLVTHLLISHFAPVLVITFALGLTLTALVRISLVLTELNETELHNLRDESTLHATAWSFDVTLRHARQACLAGSSSSAVAPRIRAKADELRAIAINRPDSSMRNLVDGYLATVRDLDDQNACAGLLGPTEGRRTQLDEDLTNVLVRRLQELQESLAKKDEEARDLAISATRTGIPLALGSLLFALFIARRTARLVNKPLATLAASARRIGQGEFRAPVAVEGPAEVIALAEDIARMQQQLQQLEKLKQGFLASVSHELRTPLSKIREALALLEDGAVGSVDRRLLRVVGIARSACEREIRLVTTLLNMSRLKAGAPLSLQEGVSIERVVRAAVQDEESDAKVRDVSLALRLDGTPVTCCLDADLVERAITNLVRNAVSVSPRGAEVRVTCSGLVGQGERPERWIKIRVSDSGPGVPLHVRQTLFQPFVTTSVPGAGRPSGVGLGLALAREVAIAHGGRLELSRTGAHGTSFDLWLAVRDKVAERRRDANTDDAPLLGTFPLVNA